MKIHYLWMLLGLLPLFTSCSEREEPNLHRISYLELSTEQILEASEFFYDRASLNRDKLGLIVPDSAFEDSFRTHRASISYQSSFWGEKITHGKIDHETIFQKCRIFEGTYWIPTKLKFSAWADSGKTSIAANPGFRFTFFPDTTLKISERLWIDIRKHGYDTTFVEHVGRGTTTERIRIKGAYLGKTIDLLYTNEGGTLLYQGRDRTTWFFEDSKHAPLYKDLFGSSRKILDYYEEVVE